MQNMFILELYFVSKPFAVARAIFSNAYPDKEVMNNTTIHRLLQHFDAQKFARYQALIERKRNS
jgi:hypothetical protein